MDPASAPSPRGGPRSTVSVVIPTRNRAESLSRLLGALAAQARRPEEIVIVDASERPASESALRRDHDLPVTVVPATPALCAQRNEGIGRVSGSYVLLLDDDIEPPPDYVERLAAFLDEHPEEGAVTGVLREPDDRGVFHEGFEVPSVRHLLFAFLFQLTVWGDVEARRGGAFAALPLRLLRRWYRVRGNTWSLAGWPLVTQVAGPVVRTAVYGLGAALVRREWLLASPYDERLGPHGIGDNYGVALGFPGEGGVAVLRDLPVTHHRVPDHRLEPAESYRRRVLALDYFLRTLAPFSRVNVAFLAWSLVGNALRSAVRRDGPQLGATLRALGTVVRGRNPLLEGGTADDGRLAS